MKGLLKTAAGLAVALAVAAGLWFYFRGRKPPAPRFETVKVERGRLVSRVTATGTLSALVTVQVGAQVSGRIASLNADFNSHVRKGQTIAKIDPQLFVAAVEQARANHLAAEGNLAKAKAQAVDAGRQYERNKQLRAQKLIAQADLDTSQANYEVQQAQVQASAGAVGQARAALHQAEINLNYTTIISPIDGVVISRNVDVGQTVAAALQAPTLFTIAEDLAKMQVDTNVAEADVGKLRAGAAATFTVDAFPGDRFQGSIRQIRNAPQNIQNVVTYDAVIDVKNSELRLKPGMTANVTFVYAEKENVLKVPNSALRFRPPPELLPARGDGGVAGGAGSGGGGRERKRGGEGPNDRRTVWTLRGGAPTSVSIKTGISDGTTTEVADGDLQESDALITDVTQPGGSTSGAAGGGGAPGGGPPLRRLF